MRTPPSQRLSYNTWTLFRDNVYHLGLYWWRHGAMVMFMCYCSSRIPPNNMRAPSVKLASCLCNHESPRMELWTFIKKTMELRQSTLGVCNWCMEIHKPMISTIDFWSSIIRKELWSITIDLRISIINWWSSIKDLWRLHDLWNPTIRQDLWGFIIDLCSSIVVPRSPIIGWWDSIFQL